jgi:hypothetical protein
MATIVEPKLDDPIQEPLAEQAELFLASRRFTPDEYMSMAKAGIFDDDDRLELLEGTIIKMMLRRPEHDNAISNVDEKLRPFCQGDLYLRIQMAIALTASHPEPDCALVRGPRKNHAHRFPGPGESNLSSKFPIPHCAEIAASKSASTPALAFPRTRSSIWKGANWKY